MGAARGCRGHRHLGVPSLLGTGGGGGHVSKGVGFTMGLGATEREENVATP